MVWENITEELTKEAVKELKAGDVLIFDFEGSPIHLKIKRNYKGRVYAEKTYLPTPDEVTVTDKVANG